jgi:hypothetical protein
MRTILKRILEKSNVRVWWTGFNWLRIGCSGESFGHGN